jgi:hypothetical protein
MQTSDSFSVGFEHEKWKKQNPDNCENGQETSAAHEMLLPTKICAEIYMVISKNVPREHQHCGDIWQSRRQRWLRRQKWRRQREGRQQ